jgi:hypothetical protein
MSDEKWQEHLAASKAEHDRRRAVEESPTDTMLDVIARLEKLEGKRAPASAEAPAKSKAKRKR